MIEIADKFDFEIDLHNDNDLPVSFNKKRHEGAIDSSNSVSKSWRIRDRVRNVCLQFEHSFCQFKLSYLYLKHILYVTCLR